jgi:hypothetical protein
MWSMVCMIVDTRWRIVTGSVAGSRTWRVSGEGGRNKRTAGCRRVNQPVAMRRRVE